MTIESAADRTLYIKDYLKRLGRDPTRGEATAIADYLMWGKDENGQNERQKKTVILETKSGTWDKVNRETSLEGLMEAPAFSENEIRSLSAVPYKVPVANFDRVDTLKKCPDDLKPIFKDIWAKIDKLDYMCGAYEVKHNKRKTPVREAICERFTESERKSLETVCELWDDLKYLRAKQELVALRRSQYPLRDIYQGIMSYHLTPSFERETLRINGEYGVFPLGVMGDPRIDQRIWAPPGELVPFFEGIEENVRANAQRRCASVSDYWASPNIENTQREISDFLWAKKADYEHTTSTNMFYIDFCNSDHWAALVSNYEVLKNAVAFESVVPDRESSLAALLKTTDWYLENTSLKKQERIIIECKKEHLKNVDIQDILEKEMGKCTYCESYVSSIYRRALEKVCEFVRIHYETVENLFFEEEFRTCTKCGHTFLRSSKFFDRSKRSAQGFSRKCKKCSRVMPPVKGKEEIEDK